MNEPHECSHEDMVVLPIISTTNPNGSAFWECSECNLKSDVFDTDGDMMKSLHAHVQAYHWEPPS